MKTDEITLSTDINQSASLYKFVLLSNEHNDHDGGSIEM